MNFFLFKYFDIIIEKVIKVEELEMNSRKIDTKDLEKFFLLDLKIKQLMDKIAPNREYAFDIEESLKYGEKFYTTVMEIEFKFLDIMDALRIFQPIRGYVEEMFKSIKREIMECNYNFDKLQACYQKNISDMDKQLVEEIKEVLVGYYLGSNLSALVSKCNTINELLHVFHSYVMNNENVLQSIATIAVKENDTKYPISLRGNLSNLAQSIFEDFPLELDCGWTDIVSLSNPPKILMMIRDRGHALTIEITEEKDGIWINYFIPKICNVEMVNALKGVRKVDKTSRNTTGMFVSDRENITSDLFDFISKVPTDNDMEYFQNLRAKSL